MGTRVMFPIPIAQLPFSSSHQPSQNLMVIFIFLPKKPDLKIPLERLELI